jgi:hypothetical protein
MGGLQIKWDIDQAIQGWLNDENNVNPGHVAGHRINLLSNTKAAALAQGSDQSWIFEAGDPADAKNVPTIANDIKRIKL